METLAIIMALGAITTQDLAPSGNAPTAGSYVQLKPYAVEGGVNEFIPLPPDVSHVGIGVAGTYTGQLNVNGTEDGVEWFVLGGYPLINLVTGIAQENIPSGVTGEWVVNVVGLQGIRVDAPNAVTGTATVSMNDSTSSVGARSAINTLATGEQSASEAASTSDQVASAQPGQLVRVVVLAAGTAPTQIFDNATAGSGKLIATIPASPTVGAVYPLAIPVVNGITVKGVANTSGLLVIFD